MIHFPIGKHNNSLRRMCCACAL